jgi:hypothetical protein
MAVCSSCAGPNSGQLSSALTSFETLLCLVDHIDTAFTTHDLAVAMTRLQRAERVLDLHRPSPVRGASKRMACALKLLCPKYGAVNFAAFATTYAACAAFSAAACAADGGRYWDRTSGHYDVNVVLYR